MAEKDGGGFSNRRLNKDGKIKLRVRLRLEELLGQVMVIFQRLECSLGQKCGTYACNRCTPSPSAQPLPNMAASTAS